MKHVRVAGAILVSVALLLACGCLSSRRLSPVDPASLQLDCASVTERVLVFLVARRVGVFGFSPATEYSVGEPKDLAVDQLAALDRHFAFSLPWFGWTTDGIVVVTDRGEVRRAVLRDGWVVKKLGRLDSESRDELLAYLREWRPPEGIPASVKAVFGSAARGQLPWLVRVSTGSRFLRDLALEPELRCDPTAARGSAEAS